jgi:hypothetical protein
MFFVFQNDADDFSVEIASIKNLIKGTSHRFVDLPIGVIPQTPQYILPIGTIEFTQSLLKLRYGIEKMNPVEIPMILRNNHFLGRDYRIVPFNQIPDNGKYFLKDASELKRFTAFGNRRNMDGADKTHLFAVSEIMNIISEYRVYIINREIYAIEYYNGDPCVFPDVQKIKQANAAYQSQPDYPRSYTIDVMVTPTGTYIVEVQPVLFSVGIYTTVISESFSRGYSDSLQYLMSFNTPAQPSF